MRWTLAVALALAALACERRDETPPPPPVVDEYPGAPETNAHPAGGTYAKVQYVAIAADEPGTIHYTIDGTAPAPGAAGTRSGRNPVFWIRAGPGRTTLTFFAVDDAGNRGPTGSAVYEVRLP